MPNIEVEGFSGKQAPNTATVEVTTKLCNSKSLLYFFGGFHAGFAVFALVKFVQTFGIFAVVWKRREKTLRQNQLVVFKTYFTGKKMFVDLSLVVFQAAFLWISILR